MVADVMGKCKAQEGPSDSDIQEVIAHAPPTTRAGQCFNACMMESFGIVWNFSSLLLIIKFQISLNHWKQMKDGKLSVEGGIKIAEMSGDPAKIKNSEIVGKECEHIGGGDRYMFNPLI